MAAREQVCVPGWAGCAGCDPSILGASLVDSTDGCLASCFLPRLERDRLIVPQSVGRLASAWKTCLLRIIV